MDEIVVGCPDAGLAPYVQRQLAERNVPSRWAAGQSMSESPAFLLLACIRNWVRSRHREDFAQLARHPDITRWLSRKHIDADWLTDLDRYHEDHLSRTYGTWWADQPNTYRIRKPFDLIENWLQDLFGPSRSMAEWMMRLRSVLREVYAKHFLNREDSVEHHALTACQIVAKEIDQLANVPAPLATTMTADEAIELVMAGIEKKVLTPHASAECVEILGWLELPLDDSRVMVVGGIHEGTVPRAVTSDQFLPNQLRERLGIDDARDRYARDAYAISTLLSGNRIVHFVVGRSTVEGDPLRPSRLLLATRGDELVRRWQKLLRPGPTENSPNGSLCASSVFQIPRPNKAIPIPERMTVSGFKAYLQCPYRFYLSHILKLKEVDDSSREMNPRLFGTLIHRVLDDFGRGPAQNSVNASEIAEYCRHALRHQAALQFGDLALPPVQIQLWQIQNLLEEFAETQAEWAAKGWRIKHIEDRLVCTFIVDGTTMEIEGRIDRIDHNDKTGQWAVLDYKTSKEAKKPAQSHRKKDGTWLDLQLPLYRHLAATKAISRPNVGYFSLPVSGKCAISCLDWTEHDFTEADKKVEEVVRNIRKRCFWPPSPTRYADEWADICMVGLLERPDL